MANLKVKKGDQVVVISGKDKGTKGKILIAKPSEGKVVVEGVNIVSKHEKARSASKPGGIIKQEGAINASNVMIVCGKCNKATRVAYKVEDGKKIRVCKKCGAAL